MYFHSLASLAMLSLVSITEAWLPQDKGMFGWEESNLSAGKGRYERRWLPKSGKIRGVNLGSSFIIEPWMAQDEWKSMGCGGAASEWDCVQHLGQDAADAAFKRHWDTWITNDDIQDLKSWGINTIRIPVGFWIKEDLVDRVNEHYPQGGLQFLDRLVGWAADANIYVIMDLHGAPGSQAANQSFTGHSTTQAGFFTESNYERAINWLVWMTERIHTNQAYRTVGLLEVMNEPDRNFPTLTSSFYPNAWTQIRNKENSLYVGNDERLHVQMMNKNWGSGDPKGSIPDQFRAAYDNHRYFVWDTSVSKSHDAYMKTACNYDAASDGDDPLIVGEWSLAVPGDIEATADWQVGNDTNKAFYSSWFLAQTQAFEKHQGWVYWCWKAQLGGDFRWSYVDGIQRGVIPKNLDVILDTNVCKQYQNQTSY